MFNFNLSQWRRRSVRSIPGHRCKHGTGRRGGLVPRVWLFEKASAIAERPYRECGKFFSSKFKTFKFSKSTLSFGQKQDQYKFVYDTLEEFVISGNSWFPVKELSQRLKEKSVKDNVTKMNAYQREYAQICKQTPRFTIGDCAGGHRGDNRDKNRDVLCVPRKFSFFSNRGFSVIETVWTNSLKGAITGSM